MPAVIILGVVALLAIGAVVVPAAHAAATRRRDPAAPPAPLPAAATEPWTEPSVIDTRAEDDAHTTPVDVLAQEPPRLPAFGDDAYVEVLLAMLGRCGWVFRDLVLDGEPCRAGVRRWPGTSVVDTLLIPHDHDRVLAAATRRDIATGQVHMSEVGSVTDMVTALQVLSPPQSADTAPLSSPIT